MNLEKPQEVSGDLFGILENISGRTYAWLALGSILVSAFLFLTGRRNWSIFIGQWPPTFLATALFFRMLHPSREPGEFSSMKRAMGETKEKASEYGSEMGGKGGTFGTGTTFERS
jgi:hypothetical protein